MVTNLPDITYLKNEDIQILTRTEFLDLYDKLPDFFSDKSDSLFFIRVICRDGVKCDCGKCGPAKGSTFILAASRDEAELIQQLIWNYMAATGRVRARGHEADVMLRKIQDAQEQ